MKKIFSNNCGCNFDFYEIAIFQIVTLQGKLNRAGDLQISKIWKNFFNKTYSYGMCGTPPKDLGLITQKCLFWTGLVFMQFEDVFGYKGFVSAVSPDWSFLRMSLVHRGITSATVISYLTHVSAPGLIRTLTISITGESLSPNIGSVITYQKVWSASHGCKSGGSGPNTPKYENC